MIITCRCGTPLELDDDMLGEEIQCPRCQMTMVVPATSTPAPVATAPPSQHTEFTTAPRPSSPFPPPSQPFPSYPQPGPVNAPQTGLGPPSSKAMACLNLGISSFTVPFVLVIPSFLFGILALRECRKYRMQGKGVAVMGMTLSAVSTLCLGAVLYFAYPWIKQAIDMSKGLKEGGDITKLLNKGAGGLDSGQLNDPQMKADFLCAQGMLKFGDPGVQITNRLREIRDIERLNRIEKALPTAKSWQELLATP